ncbi:MAG: Na+/H+ antiporter subunit E [Bauldia sp.]
MRAISLAGVLFAFWLLLSGHYTAFLVASGALAALLIAWLGLRLDYADEEGHPIDLLPRAAFVYWPWLIVEIVKAAFAVAMVIVKPSLPISPRIVRVGTSQRRPVGTVTYANSITMTPGTITVEVNHRDHALLVHALTEASAEGLKTGEMDRRVTVLEGAG